MSFALQIDMFLLALGIFYYIIRMVNKNAFSLRRSVPWLIVGLAIVFISIFPQVVSYVAHKLGFALTMNFLLFSAVLFVFILELQNTSNGSKKDEQIKKLIQEVSLLKKQIEEK